MGKLRSVQYSASLIAYAFAKKGINSGNPITQMKLQKMIFFAHGLHLALDRGELVKEVFQAWKFGPVIPEIYREYKIYGSSPITTTEYLKIFSHGVIINDRDLMRIDQDAQDSIEKTWDSLKDLDAFSLSLWTHKDGSPWKEYYKEGFSDIVIPNETIKAYFVKEFVTQEL